MSIQPQVSHENQRKYAINLLCSRQGKEAFGEQELRSVDIEPAAMNALEDAGAVQMGFPGWLPEGIRTKTPEGSHVWLLSELARARLDEGGVQAVRDMFFP